MLDIGEPGASSTREQSRPKPPRHVGSRSHLPLLDEQWASGCRNGAEAFVTVSLGGFGSVPGALIAGLLIGVIESLSAYWIGAVYKDIVVYSLFVAVLWLRPQGLMGKS